ncbi:hypothetical protein emb_1c0529 [Coriobacteriaceae bacterium EMTCatB1]|nr:hypothetical protein emb_1c0529 [Coriobacteriaceae bacterium EMTCatB1]
MSGTMTGPLALFLQALAFALVVLALFVIVHALGRRVERWRRPWARWVWVVLAAEYVLAFAALFVFKSQKHVLTIFGISYVVAIIVDVAYLLRVVFPPPRREQEPPEAPGPVAAPVVPGGGAGSSTSGVVEEDS